MFLIPKNKNIITGLYVWGDSWESAKTQCESFDYLFQSAVQMKTMLHMDPGAIPKAGTYRIDPKPDNPMDVLPARAKKRAKRNASPNSKGLEPGFNGTGQANNMEDLQSNFVPILPRDAKVLLLDIEGCTTSISFVKDQLFPYILDHLDDYVDSVLTTDVDEYATTCGALMADLVTVGQPIPEEHADDVKWMVRKLMEEDIKVPGLKALQGKMWKIGYERGKDYGWFGFDKFVKRFLSSKLLSFSLL